MGSPGACRAWGAVKTEEPPWPQVVQKGQGAEELCHPTSRSISSCASLRFYSRQRRRPFSLDSQICPRERFGERKVREFPPWSAGVRGCESTIPGDRVSLSRLPTFRTARKSEDVKTGVADNECRDPTDGAGGAFLFIESNDSGGCGCPR